ncbi:hypothetical protein B484DRAFT_410807 [Ochromonadaceae sp. CCMP2298]|nr:hypothetical protein B484DRAFT_410807 [Ochromonadaceae sp. CCMP2298]
MDLVDEQHQEDAGADSDETDFAGLRRRVGALYLEVARVTEDSPHVVLNLIDFHAVQSQRHLDQLLDSVPLLMSEWRREAKPVSVLRNRFSQLRKWWLDTWGEDIRLLCQGTLALLNMWDKEEEARIAAPLTLADLQP